MNPVNIGRTLNLNTIVLPGAGVKSSTVKLTKDNDREVFGSAKHHPALQWVKSLFSSTLREKNREIRSTLMSALRDKDSNIGLNDNQLEWMASKIKTKFGTPLSVTTVRKLINKARLSSLSSHERKEVAKAMRELKPRLRNLNPEQRKQVLAQKMDEILSSPAKASKYEKRQAEEFQRHIEERQENLERVEEDWNDFEEDFDLKPMPKVELRRVEERTEPKVEEPSSNDSPLIRELKQRFAKYPNPVDGLRKRDNPEGSNTLNSQHLGGVVASIKSTSNNEPQPVSLSDELRSILASIDNPVEEETIEENPVDVNEQLETPENVSVDEHLETPEEISTENEQQTPEEVHQGNIVSGDVSQELRDILRAIDSEEGEGGQDVSLEQDHATTEGSQELNEDQLVAKGLEEFLKNPGGLARHESDVEAGKNLAAWLNQNK